MARYVVDCAAVLRLAAEGAQVTEHTLFAPTLLRSQVLSTLHELVHAGKLKPGAAEERLDRVNALPIRLLGDLVLRREAWKVADRLGWASTYDAEYVALTILQADALVAVDKALAREARKLVAVEPYASLL